MYEVPAKGTMKSEIPPHSSAAKHGHASKKVAWRKFSIHSLQVESIFPVAHNEEKVKRTSLCFLCSYVKMDVFRSQYEKMNVFVKPDEQCRACSNMVMARKERLAPSTYDEEIVKRTFLCLLCSYVKKDLFRSTLKLLSEPPTYVLMSKRTYLGHNMKC